jgi:hypothetical protein
MKQLFIIALGIVALTSCNTTIPISKQEAYKNLYEEKPLSILVMPPINRSVKVEAKEFFYSTLASPIAQKGYYIVPPLLAMEILKEESAYDAERFIDHSVMKFGEVFGIDAVLFTTIHEWSKSQINSRVTVKVEYLMKSAKTDEVLFHRTGEVALSTSVNTGSLIGDVVGSIVSTALTKEIVVGRKCNAYSLSDLPAGKYDDINFDKDGIQVSQPKEFSVVIQ